jgi:beta-glucanase (GH16 family)
MKNHRAIAERLCAFAIVLVAGASFLFLGSSAYAQGTGWNLVFSDEFNGSSLNTSLWATTYPGGGQCTQQNEDGVYESGAISEGGGNLTITAANNGAYANDGGGFICPGPWESGLIQSQAKFTLTYGYFEERAKIPSGTGFWPAFWLYAPSGYSGPEIDIMEMLNTASTTVYQTYHAFGTSGQGDQYAATSSIDCSTNFCDFAVDWEPGSLTFYLNGVATYTYTGSDVSSTAMYILTNLAVGGSGSWPGSWNGGTPSPSYMQIDYIRAYQHPSSGSGCYSSIPGATPIPSTTCDVSGPSYTYPEVQDEQGSSTNASALQTMDAAVTRGHFLVGMARDGNKNCPPDTISISDNGSLASSWQNALTYNDTVNGTCLIMGWAANVTGSPTVITGTFASSGAQNDVNIAEFSLSTSEKVDVVGAGTTNGPASSATTSTVTTTQSSDVLIACLGTVGAQASGITVSAGTGSATWHLLYYQAQRGVCAWATTSSVGTYSAQFSWTGGALPSETIIAAFTSLGTSSSQAPAPPTGLSAIIK